MYQPGRAEELLGRFVKDAKQARDTTRWKDVQNSCERNGKKYNKYTTVDGRNPAPVDR